MYGIHEQALGNEEGMLPCVAKDGTKIMSVNLLLEKEDTPVIWRGPIIAGVVTQFWTDVMWGDVDYLFVDMPPGTGDVPLTVFQSLPVDGVVIVTSPQDLVSMIVKKAYHMAKDMNIPVLGIVENFSYLECPDCGRKIEVFGKSHIEDIAKELEIPVLGRIPIDPKLTEAVENEAFDQGEQCILKRCSTGVGIMIDYRLLKEQMDALTGTQSRPIPNLANASALLWQILPDLNWAGFYLMEDGALYLGPFQGKTACIRIPLGQGSVRNCGTERSGAQSVRRT